MRSIICWASTVCVLCCGCADEEWKCVAPTGSIATAGTFELNYIGETASFESAAMQVRVNTESADAVTVWACQKRGDELWTVELDLTRASATQLPANFSLSGTAPKASAWLTRYDQYQVLEDQLGDSLSTNLSGTLAAFDPAAGALDFNVNVSEPCGPIQCQASLRSLVVDADLTWEPR